MAQAIDCEALLMSRSGDRHRDRRTAGRDPRRRANADPVELREAKSARLGPHLAGPQIRCGTVANQRLRIVWTARSRVVP
jgi:hypothetical protein